MTLQFNHQFKFYQKIVSVTITKYEDKFMCSYLLHKGKKLEMTEENIESLQNYQYKTT
mgnify:CR=1 FL=1